MTEDTGDAPGVDPPGDIRERVGAALVEYEAALEERTLAAMADPLDRMIEQLEAAR